MTGDGTAPGTGISASAGWSVVVPAGWIRVPLEGTARDAAVRSIVRERIGVDDRAAIVRRDVRDGLVRSTDEAVKAGGRFMALIQMDVAGIPVTGTMVVYEVDPGLGRASTRALEKKAARAQASDAFEVHRNEFEGAVVVREVTQSAIDRTDAEGQAVLPELRADYWVDAEIYPGVLYFVFTTPMIPLREGLVPLFDAVVESLHPVPPVDAPGDVDVAGDDTGDELDTDDEGDRDG